MFLCKLQQNTVTTNMYIIQINYYLNVAYMRGVLRSRKWYNRGGESLKTRAVSSQTECSRNGSHQSSITGTGGSSSGFELVPSPLVRVIPTCKVNSVPLCTVLDAETSPVLDDPQGPPHHTPPHHLCSLSVKTLISVRQMWSLLVRIFLKQTEILFYLCSREDIKNMWKLQFWASRQFKSLNCVMNSGAQVLY